MKIKFWGEKCEWIYTKNIVNKMIWKFLVLITRDKNRKYDSFNKYNNEIVKI